MTKFTSIDLYSISQQLERNDVFSITWKFGQCLVDHILPTLPFFFSNLDQISIPEEDLSILAAFSR